jgi:DNA polymerase-3 subunit delta'
MSRAPKRDTPDEAPESDVFEGTPHPRFASRLVGHAAAEAELLEGYRSGRLAHAWLIGGRQGVGKATLAWRFAKFVLANPDPTAVAVRDARDLTAAEGRPILRQLEALAHPDFALFRRVWNGKAFYTEIRIDDVRSGMQVFHMSAALGGWRVAIVDCADDLNRNSANALLKIIEEPPAKSLILILAHRLGAVLPTIRSRCRRLMLEPLSPREIETVISGLGDPWSSLGVQKITEAAERGNGSVWEALNRLAPGGQKVGGLIESALRRLPKGDVRANIRLAEAAAARGAEADFQRVLLAIYDWIAAESKKPSSPARLEGIADLWDTVRATVREAEALNVDKRALVMALFEEISTRAPALLKG